MKTMVVTVAGSSTRFSKSLGRECVKCLYHEGDAKNSLLYRLLSQARDIDRFVIVGGYRYEELKRAFARELAVFRKKTVLIENPFYAEYGSGYSLYCGLKAAMALAPEEVLFAEGDLYVDMETLEQMIRAGANVVTYNREPILASKAVAFYYDLQNKIHYIYDTKHGELAVDGPFSAIYNSGQIWKFRDINKLSEVYSSLSEAAWQGTNLVFVEKYFRAVAPESIRLLGFDRWVNCNTVADYRTAFLEGEKHENIE